MTSAFSWQKSISLCFIVYSKAKFACYSRYFLTFYFCIPVLYNEKDLLGVSSSLQQKGGPVVYCRVGGSECSSTYMGSFPDGSEGKVSACNAGDSGSIPGLGRSPGGGKGSPLQYSGLENSMGL